MSGAKEVASKATENIHDLITDMLSGDHLDNQVSLGRLLCGKEQIQVQLKVTRHPPDFLDSDEEDPE